MRVVLFGVVATFLLAGTAFAACGHRPDRFHMPNGLTATRAQMQEANQALIDYTRHVNRYLHCLSREAKTTRAEAKKVRHSYSREVDAFNASRINRSTAGG